MKYIKNIIFVVIGLYITTLLLIYFDLEEKRPVISLF